VGLLKTEIAICDFLKRLGPWILSWTRVRNPENRDSAYGISQCKEIPTCEIGITRFPIEKRERKRRVKGILHVHIGVQGSEI
jgi:hypothetical protein